MLFALSLISIAAGVTSLVCWIIVIAKMFPTSIVTGLCGLVCPLYALYWASQNQDRGLSQVVPVWGVAILAGLVVRVILRFA